MTVFSPKYLFSVNEFKIYKVDEKQITIHKGDRHIGYYGDNELLMELLEGVKTE